MSLDSNLLNATDASTFSTSVASVLDESMLNNNVDLSQLGASMEESTINESTMQTPGKLSITLEQEERDLLRTGRQMMRSESAIGDQSSSTLPTFDQSACSNGGTQNDTCAKETTISNDSSEEEEEEESVIPVDDDETDESTLQTSKVQTQNESVASTMFSHLQIPKTTAEDMEASKTAPTEVDDIVDTVEKEVDCSAMSVESLVENGHEKSLEVSLLSQAEEDSLLLHTERGFFQHSFVELGRRVWPSTNQQQCYTKGCLWSPDGTCLLVPVHLDGMHVIELPTDLYTTQDLNSERELSPLDSAVHVKEGGMVYDCTWYPFMKSSDPDTCCWVASRQHEPIHMWDAFSGELRCSYRGYDDVDEVESAISIAFSNDGQKVVGGYKKDIKIFDTNVPGRVYTSIPVKQTVSCFAFTNENDNCVTTGSWNSHIYHYDLRAPKLGPLFTLGGHNGGITWLKYSSYNTDNWYLFSGARKDNKILQWDMRNYQKPVKSHERNVATNQRIYFDMSPLQKWLISGDTGGSLRIFDLDNEQQNMELPLHTDCCNGVSFHSFLPILCSSSGQYHFIDAELEKENSDKDEIIVNYENSVIFWWFGPSSIQ